MHVMSLIVRLRLEKCTSTRLRRLCAQAMVETIHHNFNVAIADVGRDNCADELTLAACCVRKTKKETREILSRVAEALCSYPEATPVARPEFLNH
jgi:uncharacterized protein YlxP (DUF503 family)